MIKGRISNYQKNVLNKAFEHYVSKYPLESVKISVKNIDNDLCGVCEWEHGETWISISKNIKLSEKVSTLFHELTHATQFNTKKLKLIGNSVMYRGKKYGNYEKWVNCEYCEYEKIPWEHEADKTAEKLMKTFKGLRKAKLSQV